MEEEKILNVTQLGVVDKLQNEDVILLIRNTDNGKQCFQIKGFDFRGESAYEAALSQGFEGTYQDWVQQIKEVTEYDTKSLLSFNGIAANDANSALRSGIYPFVTKNVPINGETFTIQTLRTTTAVYNQYVSTQIALGVTGAAIGKVYIRKNTQKSGKTTYEDWIKISNETSITKKLKPKTQYIIGKAIPIGKLNGGARLNAYAVTSKIFRFKLSRVPQLRGIILSETSELPLYKRIQNALEGVTWHLFIDDREEKIKGVSVVYDGVVLQIEVTYDKYSFYQLDESKSSVDLSSDMYIYLRTEYRNMSDAKFTSKTLSYRAGKRIWEPNFGLPYITEFGFEIFACGGTNIIQLQKLLTRQRRSKKSGFVGQSISKFGYRGQRRETCVRRGGIYRYRVVRNGKKTQWRTISILKRGYHWIIK